MKNPHTTIRALLRTEKGTNLLKDNKYNFVVNRSANKIEIKKAIEYIYKVKVKDVNTFIAHGKLKRVRTQYGRTPDIKKAVVTLKEGSKIEVT